MELDHEFTVPVPVDQAWSVLLDVERVALCMPGATLDAIDGSHYRGRLKVRLGAMTITYRGTAEIVEADEKSRALTIKATGKEARGSGTASATIRARMSDQDGTTLVSVHTVLNVTGRPAQFGRNILSEVGGRLIGRFAKALAAELQETPAPADPAQPAAPEPQTATAETTAPAETATPPAGTATTAQPTETPDTSTTEAAPPAEPADSPAAEATAPTETPPADASETAAAPSSEATASPADAADASTAAQPTDPTETPDASAAEATAPTETAEAAGVVDQQGAVTDSGDAAVVEVPQETVGQQGAAASAARASGRNGAARPRGMHRREHRDDDAIDLVEVAGPAVAKRAAPVLGALAALLTVRYLFRRRRGRHHR